jgi:hypothetical protein
MKNSPEFIDFMNFLRSYVLKFNSPLFGDRIEFLFRLASEKQILLRNASNYLHCGWARIVVE